MDGVQTIEVPGSRFHEPYDRLLHEVCLAHILKKPFGSPDGLSHHRAVFGCGDLREEATLAPRVVEELQGEAQTVGTDVEAEMFRGYGGDSGRLVQHHEILGVKYAGRFAAGMHACPEQSEEQAVVEDQDVGFLDARLGSLIVAVVGPAVLSAAGRGVRIDLCPNLRQGRWIQFLAHSVCSLLRPVGDTL